MSDTLPIILPTVPGRVEGIVSLDPPTVQCQGCGATYTHPKIGRAVMLSGYRFHWQTGGTRLCKACRLERLPKDCICAQCREDRTGSIYG